MEAKTNILSSCVVTAQLICAFVFAYAKSRFSLDAAQVFPECLRRKTELMLHSV